MSTGKEIAREILSREALAADSEDSREEARLALVIDERLSEAATNRATQVVKEILITVTQTSPILSTVADYDRGRLDERLRIRNGIVDVAVKYGLPV